MTISAYIERFQDTKVQAKNLVLPQKDVITEKTFLDGLVKPVHDKLRMDQSQTKRRIKDIVEGDGLRV